MMWFINYFHIQILLIELLFCYRMQRREHFLVRFLPMTAVYCGLPFLVEGSFFNRHLVWGWFTFGFLIMFVLSGVLVFSCFRMNLRQTVFYCCVAHTLQHMVHCLYRIAEIVLMLNYIVNATALRVTGSLRGAYVVFIGLLIVNFISWSSWHWSV